MGHFFEVRVYKGFSTRRFETLAEDVHIRIRMATRGVCSVCHGRTYLCCGQCGIPMHKRCFDTKYCQQ